MATHADGDASDPPPPPPTRHSTSHSAQPVALAGAATTKQLTAKQRGKQQAESQEEADDDATQAAVQELQWRAGVNRQSQPAAHQHQVAASKTAAAKRTANAMPPEERTSKRNAHAREKYAQRAIARAAEAKAARNQARQEATNKLVRELLRHLKQEGDEKPTGDELYAFQAYACMGMNDNSSSLTNALIDLGFTAENPEPFCELFDAWRESDHYKDFVIDRDGSSGEEFQEYDEQEQEEHSSGDNGEFSEQERPSDYDSDPGWGNACLGNASPRQPSPPPPDGDPSSSSTALENGDDPLPPPHPPHPPHPSLPRGVSTDDWWDRQAEAEYVRQEQLAIRDNAQRALELSRSTLSPHELRMQREQAAGPPPRREQVQYGERGDLTGDHRFRVDRESWYERFTGQSIAAVSLQEQNELCDVIARRYRAYSDGRTDSNQ